VSAAPEPAKNLPRWVIAFMIAAGAVVAAVVVLVVLALMSTDLERLQGQVPAFVDQGRRQPKTGCGLTERPTDAGCAPAIPTGTGEREVSFPTTTELGPKALKGTLSLPQGLGPRPAVVLVHGSGPSTRDQPVPGDLLVRLDPPLPVFKLIADHLVQRGLVVLRYDKRTCPACYRGEAWNGDPDRYLERFSFKHFARDAEAALDHLKTLPEVDPDRLVVIGHSQGAALLPEILEGREDVAAAVWLAGFSGPFSEAMLGQLEAFADIRAGQYDWLGAKTVRLTRDTLAECFEKLKQPGYDEDEVCIGGGVRQRALAEYEAESARTRARLDTLGVPALFVQGTLDRNAPRDELVRLRESLKGDVELHSLEGLTHALTQKQTPALSAGVTEALTAFLRSVGD
jgi:alpha-beta hydrolase superfamily lysophospholipase